MKKITLYIAMFLFLISQTISIVSVAYQHQAVAVPADADRYSTGKRAM